MKKAWIDNGFIRDIAHGDPEELFHPDIAKLYDVDVPDSAENGDGWLNGQLTKPEPAPASEPAPAPAVFPKVSPVEFKMLFTSEERIAIKAARHSIPVLDDAFEILEDPRLKEVDLGLQSIQGLVSGLVGSGLITADRVSIILSGKIL